MDNFIKTYKKEIAITEGGRIEKMNSFAGEKYISFSRHYQLFNLFKELIKILDNNNIQYFIGSGVLLGLFRHNNSFIPWDDDLDIYVLKKDKTKLFDIFTGDYKIQRADTLLKVIKFTKGKYTDDNNIFIDIFVLEEKNGIFHHDEEEYKNIWPSDFFYSNELFPLKNMDLNLYLPDGKIFDKLHVKVPNNSKSYLNRLYPSWQNKYVISTSHSDFFNIYQNKDIIKDNFSIYPYSYYCPYCYY